MAAVTAKPDARQVAVQALIRVQDEDAYSNITLDAALRESGLTGRDAAFATALFYLSLERRITLLHCIKAHCPHKLSKVVGAVLQTAIAQLLYMDQVPRSAAVNEAVRLTRQMGQARSAGLVNAVLRSFIRAGCAVPPVEGDAARRMAVAYSCDDALAQSLMDWYGADTAEAILSAALGHAPIFLRVNTLKTDSGSLIDTLAAEGIEAASGPTQNSLVVSGGDLTATRAYADGLFHVQDLSGQQAVALLDPQPGERILDVCAAPGGKSFTLAQHMGDRGEVVSCDLHAGRLGLIHSGAERLGLASITALQNDGAVPNPALGFFDRILCDVPCSGYGVIRRKPELKYNPPAKFRALPELQYKILETSSHYLNDGGRLLYTTCTLAPDECEGVVRRFLQKNPEFSPLNWCDEGHMKTLLPTDPQGGDGFFIAAITRGGDRT